ncbi:hypothetical protein SAMN05421788_103320 [Filimonas lacunae]|uniref:Uncharacterized protein n=1 Tax=Filimonas lacunae TaxID=477680 RepID=A0A1N7P9V3_9BACT|nr:hypothetical protein SAMN05421788_103320 [Filimonas lacunae]
MYILNILKILTYASGKVKAMISASWYLPD